MSQGPDDLTLHVCVTCRAVATILDGLARYATAPDGLVPWRERPEAFRKGVVARIPPSNGTAAA